MELVLFLEVQQGSQTSLRVVRGNLGVPFELLQGIRPYLKLRGNSESFFLVAGDLRVLWT